MTRFLPGVPVWRKVLALTLVVAAVVLWQWAELIPFAVMVGGIAPMLLTTSVARPLPAPDPAPWADPDGDVTPAAGYERLVRLRAWADGAARRSARAWTRPRSRSPRPSGVLARGIAAAIVAVTALALLVGEPALIPAVVLLLVAAGALVTGARTPRPGRRHRPMLAWARTEGWEYRPADRSLLHGWSGPPHPRGEGARYRDVLWRDRDAVSATLRHRGLLRDHRDPARAAQHVVAVVLPAALPGLVLTPHADDRPADRFGPDVVTESPDFNRHWRVRADDPRTAHALLPPLALERLMAADLRDAGLAVEGRSLRAWWPGETDLDRIVERVAAVLDIALLIPRHLWQDDRYAPGAAGRAGEQQ